MGAKNSFLAAVAVTAISSGCAAPASNLSLANSSSAIQTNKPHSFSGCGANKTPLNENHTRVEAVKPYFSDNLEQMLMQKNPAFQQECYQDILITGPQNYISKSKRSLELIRIYDPVNWPIVQINISKITLAYHSGIDVATGRCATNENGWNEDDKGVAGEFVHDAWHREYYRRDEPYRGEAGERKCLERQNEFFEKVSYPKIDIEYTLSLKYWETGFEQRNW